MSGEGEEPRRVTPAERLVMALGWDIDDFLNEVGSAKDEDLVGCLAILEEDTPEAPDWINQRATAGAVAVRRELGDRRPRGVPPPVEPEPVADEDDDKCGHCGGSGEEPGYSGRVGCTKCLGSGSKADEEERDN